MKNVLMAVGIFALLPLAIPAILVFVVVAASLAYWLAPVLWLVAAAFVIIKCIRWVRRDGSNGSLGNGVVGMVDRDGGSV